MKIVFFGTSTFGIRSLEALKKSTHSIDLIVTTIAKPKGRELKRQPSPVKEWAVKNSIPILEASNTKTGDVPDVVRKVEADLFVVISFGLILSKEMIDTPKLMTLNVHSSLLPKHRGAAPMHWAMIHGDKETGVTVMRMIEKLDAGDIMLQKKTQILAQDDICSLEQRLSGLGADALVETLQQIEKGTVQFTAQDEAASTYARKLTKEDGRIHWSKSAAEISGQVRAMKVWPTAYTFCGEKRLIVGEVYFDGAAPLKGIAPGTILTASKEKGIWVASADYPVELKALKLEGRNMLEAKDFLNGFTLKPGQLFE